ncbi:hypothetical protein ETB97_011715 [Aspergillus alliaceus]|uniref:Uncharacterized protein n=1 Tax=Petromyces alliaceus TaxID=209559 RepID=A0A8H6E0G5_PETAA|nr:hypothetical protein ETB97_011715 [Aspergillus burnettii]
METLPKTDDPGFWTLFTRAVAVQEPAQKPVPEPRPEPEPEAAPGPKPVSEARLPEDPLYNDLDNLRSKEKEKREKNGLHLHRRSLYSVAQRNSMEWYRGRLGGTIPWNSFEQH